MTDEVAEMIDEVVAEMIGASRTPPPGFLFYLCVIVAVGSVAFFVAVEIGTLYGTLAGLAVGFWLSHRDARARYGR